MIETFYCETLIRNSHIISCLVNFSIKTRISNDLQWSLRSFHSTAGSSSAANMLEVQQMSPTKPITTIGRYVSNSGYRLRKIVQGHLHTRHKQDKTQTCTEIISKYRLSTIGDRAFLVAAARVWNDLRQHVTSTPSLSSFCSRPKTHLFRRCFPDFF